jgi:hypothetical protein
LTSVLVSLLGAVILLALVNLVCAAGWRGKIPGAAGSGVV